MGTMAAKKTKTKATMPPSQRAKRNTRATCKAGMYDMKHHPMDDVLRPKALKARETRRAGEKGGGYGVGGGGGAEEDAAARNTGAVDGMGVEVPAEASDVMRQPVDGEAGAVDVTHVMDVGGGGGAAEEDIPRLLTPPSTGAEEEVPGEVSDLTQPLDGEASDQEASEAGSSPPAIDDTDSDREQSEGEDVASQVSHQVSATNPAPHPRSPWHTPAPAFDRRQYGFTGNPHITLGALNQWVQLQGSLQTLGVFEMEAPTRAERLKYRHQRAILELLAKGLEDVEGEDGLGD
ncbi:MAG: hypothetical protein Q9207_008541 [Kuettlingeria erythrocarpa]